jgi:hypothetical protein
MRIVTVLTVATSLAACGHIAPYSEHRGANAERYDIAGRSYLRVPYRVVVYDLVPRTYLDEEWIAVGEVPPGDHLLLYCPPTLRDRHRKPITMKGFVNISTSEVQLDLMFPAVAGGGAQDRPYKFNGTWPLIKGNGAPPEVPRYRRDACEKDAL